MKCRVWGINYAPECTGIGIYTTQMCDYLAEQGHEVSMVAGFTFYPDWRKAEKDRLKLFRSEKIGRVQVYRCWQYVPRKVKTVTRIFHELSFITTSFLRNLFLPAADVYIVASPPLLLGVTARLLCWIKRRPYVFRVLDLQPDAALRMGMVKPGFMTRVMYACEAMAYQGASYVCGICDGMLEAFRRKGVPEEKIRFVPDWFHRSEFEGPGNPGAFRNKLGLPEDALLAVYSGNIGVKQGLNILVDAAQYLEGSRVHIVICGEGAARPRLEKALEGKSRNHIHLRPLVPRSEYLEMLQDTDVALITQRADSGACFFPNKLLATLASGNVVLSVADPQSELFKVMKEGEFGWNVLPGDAQGVADRLKAVAEDGTSLEVMKENGRDFVQTYDSKRILPAFESMLIGLVQQEGRQKEDAVCAG